MNEQTSNIKQMSSEKVISILKPENEVFKVLTESLNEDLLKLQARVRSNSTEENLSAYKKSK